MTFSGVFFDLGGTLFSYRNVARTNVPILIETASRLGSAADARAIKHAYAQASREVNKHYEDAAFYLHRDMFDDMFKRFCELIEARYDDVIHDWYRTEQHHAILGCLELRADCGATMEALRARGKYLSIASNIDDDMLDPLVEREGLHRYFHHWTSSEGAQACKPHRRFFEVILEKSGLAPHEVLFVGDSPEHDIAGARAMGMQTALITEDGILPPLQSGRATAEADYAIQSLAQLVEIVR